MQVSFVAQPFCVFVEVHLREIAVRVALRQPLVAACFVHRARPLGDRLHDHRLALGDDTSAHPTTVTVFAPIVGISALVQLGALHGSTTGTATIVATTEPSPIVQRVRVFVPLRHLRIR
jgi:hypothetical protein